MRMSTFCPTPARSRFARAIAALAGSASIVTTVPSSGMPRAIQIVEYAPSVPISSTRRAPEMRASRCSSLPETGATSIAGSPAACCSATAASRSASCPTSVSVR